MTDADYMKKVRKALHLTQDEMAKKMGYTHQKDISNIERGVKGLSNQARKLLECIERNEL